MSTTPRTLAALIALLFATAATAQESAAVWAEKNRAAIEAATSDLALADTLRQGHAGLDALFAQIKTNGESDPVACIRVAALAQFVMRKEGNGFRGAYAEALLSATQRASEADVACVFLNQLRWCGLPSQTSALRALEKSDKPGVAALAAMAVQAVNDDRASKAATPKDTTGSALNKELDGLAPQALTQRLLQVFDGPDTVLAGIALARARTAGGGAKETALWTTKLSATADQARKAMLLDMLAERGDATACDAIAACLTSADDAVAAAAQRALIKLSPKAFAAQIPSLLKTLPPERQNSARDGVRQLKTDLAGPALTQAYDTFSDAGKKVALEVIKERRLAEAVPLGLAALDAKDEESVIAGYRLLREIADKRQAEVLVAKLLTTTGRVTPEAESAIAAAARRDVSGAYAAALLQALGAAPDAQKPIALEAAGRLGDDALLKPVEAATRSPNAEIATAAVRALAAWSDSTAVPALLRLAATATNAKHQTLAQRGLAQKLNEDGADKKAAFTAWQGLRASVPDEARRKGIDDLFKQEVNVALNKPVQTDVATEGSNVPAYLTDGTLAKAWHGNRTPAHAIVDLGASQPISAAHVTFYHSDGRTYTFTLELSDDGKSWKQVAGNAEAPKPATADGLRLEFGVTSARYARLTVLKNSANQAVHVLELKLFSAATP